MIENKILFEVGFHKFKLSNSSINFNPYFYIYIMSQNELLSHIQRKRRFRLYFVLFILGMIVSFYSGYQIGIENCKGHDGENSDLKISLKLKEIVNNPGGVGWSWWNLSLSSGGAITKDWITKLLIILIHIQWQLSCLHK